ncbi:MAG: diguanylate cyclase [Deltaproteobacteria bacterium]|nr:diguanylate cyclase [Deltaproteobacteria bacterium]
MEPEKIDYNKESILIVDDDEYLRDTLEKLLKTLGFSTSSISNGSDALELLNEKEFTFVLTDMKMPGIDGMELIQKVSDNFDVNVIAMTGYAEGYKYVDVINAGASDFIKKPFGIEELEAKIRRILAERNLRKELNRLSITDSLTELFNQRHFYARLQDEVIRAERQRHPLSLILLDLNGFKKYNDTYGHLAGDEILRQAGVIINSSIREGVDSGYRYGGDEFTIILIDADMDIAKDIGLRVQNSFKENEEVTVSLGYAKFDYGMSVTDLVSEADKDLYRAKKKNSS